MDIGLVVGRFIAGAIVGAFAGLLGGIVGGWISGYFDPLTRAVKFERGVRLALATAGARSARVFGALAGFTVGAAVAVIGDIAPLLVFIAAAAVMFWLIARWLERKAGESIAGFPGGVVVGAILGVVGGYAGRFIVAMALGPS